MEPALSLVLIFGPESESGASLALRFLEVQSRNGTEGSLEIRRSFFSKGWPERGKKQNWWDEDRLRRGWTKSSDNRTTVLIVTCNLASCDRIYKIKGKKGSAIITMLILLNDIQSKLLKKRAKNNDTQTMSFGHGVLSVCKLWWDLYNVFAGQYQCSLK